MDANRTGARSSAARRAGWVPVEDANAVPTMDVVTALGLKPADEAGKYECPAHAGSSLHVYEHRAYCFGRCGSMSNTDLVMAALGLGFTQALAWMGGRFKLDGTRPPLNKIPPRERVSTVDLTLQREILEHLLSHVRLTPNGRSYLEGRGLDPDRAEKHGHLVSIDAEDWAGVRRLLGQEYSWPQLGTAGLQGLGWFSADPAHPSPWPEPVDVLLLPYRDHSAALQTVRMRRISGSVGPKYRGMRGTSTLSTPFGAHLVYPRCVGRTIHVTEGELDAWTLMSAYRELAIGTPGAAAVRPEWFAGVANASRITTWGDGDEAGSAFNALVATQIDKCLGRAWVESHPVHAIKMPPGMDVNDLHVAGQLAEVLREVAQ